MPQPSIDKLKKIARKQQTERKSKGIADIPASALAKIDRGNPKWYSPEGTDIRVTLPDGRVCVVGEQPREIPRAYYKAAIKAGCLADTQIKPADMKVPTSSIADDPEQRSKVIHAKILEAATAEDPEDPRYANAFVQASGLPDIRWLTEACGFTVTREERDAVFNQIKIELGDDEEEENENFSSNKKSDDDA